MTIGTAQPTTTIMPPTTATAPSTERVKAWARPLSSSTGRGSKPAPGSKIDIWMVASDAACSRFFFWAVSCSICWRTLNRESCTCSTSPTAVARPSSPRRASSWALRLARRAS